MQILRHTNLKEKEREGTGFSFNFFEIEIKSQSYTTPDIAYKAKIWDKAFAAEEVRRKHRHNCDEKTNICLTNNITNNNSPLKRAT